MRSFLSKLSAEACDAPLAKVRQLEISVDQFVADMLVKSGAKRPLASLVLAAGPAEQLPDDYDTPMPPLAALSICRSRLSAPDFRLPRLSAPERRAATASYFLSRVGARNPASHLLARRIPAPGIAKYVALGRRRLCRLR